MDIAWSHLLHYKILKQSQERDKSLKKGIALVKKLDRNTEPIKKTCTMCGQDPYFCQCKNINIKLKLNKK